MIYTVTRRFFWVGRVWKVVAVITRRGQEDETRLKIKERPESERQEEVNNGKTIGGNEIKNAWLAIIFIPWL